MEILLAIYIGVYLLWIIALMTTGDMSVWFPFTLTYVFSPFAIAISAVIALVLVIITPIAVIFSKTVRKAAMEKKDELL